MRPLAGPVAYARHSDPRTSQEAAESLTAAHLRASLEAVLECAQRLPHFGFTDVALIAFYRSNQYLYEWPEQSDSGIRTRRSELVRAGLLVDSSEKIKLRTGRRAIVWRLP